MSARAAVARRGIPAVICSNIWKPSTPAMTAPGVRSACRSNGSTGRTSISAVFPAPSSAAASGRATRLPRSPPGEARQIRTIIGPGGELELCRGRRFGHHHAGRRDRYRSRGYAGGRARPSAGRRPVRRSPGLDVQRQAAARALLSDEDQSRDRRRNGHRHPPPARHRYLVEACREDARTQRDRRLQHVHCQTAAVRSLRREPRDRRVHSDRSLFQRDGRRRHDQFRAAPRHQCPSAESGREQGQAVAPHAPSPGRGCGLPACRAPENRRSPT